MGLSSGRKKSTKLQSKESGIFVPQKSSEGTKEGDVYLKKMVRVGKGVPPSLWPKSGECLPQKLVNVYH